jgi:hypothetical protein
MIAIGARSILEKTDHDADAPFCQRKNLPL